VSCSWTRSSARLLKDLVSRPQNCTHDVAYRSASSWYFLTLRHCASSSSATCELICLSWLQRVCPATMYSSNILFPLLGSVSLACAATVEVYWEITWVNAAPDGYPRPVIGINGKWPCPLLEANVGDIVIVHVDNQLGNETTGIHFHGINQLGTPEMDGPSSVTQCSIPPGSSVTYKWLVCDPSKLPQRTG
jgi:hypothetical protein